MECGGNYLNSSGILSSPLYPLPYPHMADCVYLISQTSGIYIGASILDMDIACPATGSLTDSIEMRDGISELSPLMGIFCGNISKVPTFMKTTQNHLRIRLSKNKVTTSNRQQITTSCRYVGSHQTILRADMDSGSHGSPQMWLIE